MNRKKRMYVKLNQDTWDKLQTVMQPGESGDATIRRLLDLPTIFESNRRKKSSMEVDAGEFGKLRRKKSINTKAGIEEILNNGLGESLKNSDTHVSPAIRKLVVEELQKLGGVAETRRVIERVEERFRESPLYNKELHEKMQPNRQTLFQTYVYLAFHDLKRNNLAFCPSRSVWALYSH